MIFFLRLRRPPGSTRPDPLLPYTTLFRSGVNTPQFDWIKTNPPKKPKPASPPYQPEIAARAIHFAAHRRRKQIIVGFPSLKAIWTDRIASPVLVYYLAETGFSGQKAKSEKRRVG